MPGGVDMHAHIAGPKVNVARKMRPEDKRKSPMVRRTPLTRSGTTGSVPSTFATGYLYAGLGYTTAFDAAIPPLGARHAHEEFHDTPVIDKGFFVLMGNNHYVLNQVASGDMEKLRGFCAWLLGAAKAYAIKLVNPGGVEVWKEGGGNVHSLDEPVEHFDNVTPRQIITALAQTAIDLRLAAPRPHPLQQPRPARQLDHDARYHEGPGGPAGPPDAHPVPQLRRRPRRSGRRSAHTRSSSRTTSTRIQT